MYKLFSNRRLLLLAILLVVSNLIFISLTFRIIFHFNISLNFLSHLYFGSILLELFVLVLIILLYFILLVSIAKPVIKSILSNDGKFRRAVDFAPFPLMIHTEDGSIVAISKSLTDISGYLPAEIPTFEIWADKALGKKKDVILNEIHSLYTNDGRTQTGEYDVTCKDGSKRIWEFSSTSLGNLEDGRQAVISMAKDVTEQRTAEESLRQSEAKHSSMISNIADVIAIVGADGIIKYKSPNIFKWFGWQPEELLGKYAWDTVHANDLDYVQNVFYTLMKEDKAFKRIEYRYICKDGSYKMIELSAVNLINDNIIKGVLVNYHDISDRNKYEIELKSKTEEIEIQNKQYKKINHDLSVAVAKAEESDRLKTAFLQNVSHEIRTPMNSIMGFSELLAKNYNNKIKVDKFSEIIKLRCRDLLDIINDLLDIAKIESGQISFNYENCNLKIIFRDLEIFFKESQKYSGKKDIKFTTDIPEKDENISVVTDKVKLMQIYMNLISNAFKFTEKGEIKAGYYCESPEYIICYVQDTGVGIQSENHDAIFNRFTQLDPGVNHVVGGTGLGLSIVKGLVSLFGGKIWLKSELGKGSTFYFSIPVNNEKMIIAEDSVSEITTNFNYSGAPILLVEDDPSNAIYFIELLSETGIEIIHKLTGSEAIQYSLCNDLELILMDIRLPDMSGYHATKEIKKHKPQIKIIAQTAYANSDEKQKAINAGCIDYISKPFDESKLLAMIKKHLS